MNTLDIIKVADEVIHNFLCSAKSEESVQDTLQQIVESFSDGCSRCASKNLYIYIEKHRVWFSKLRKKNKYRYVYRVRCEECEKMWVIE